MAGDSEPPPGTGAAAPGQPPDPGPENLFTPRTEAIDLRGTPQWPVERGPLPSGDPDATLLPPGPAGPPGDGSAPPAARAAVLRRLGTVRFAVGAVALLAVVGTGTTLALQHRGSSPTAGAAASSPPVQPVLVTAGASTSPVTATTTAPTPTPSTPTVTTSAPTTATTSAPTTATTTRPPTSTRPAATSSSPRSSTTTTTTTTTTTSKPPARSYSVSVAADKDAVPGIAVALGSTVTVKASGTVVGGYFQQDSCTGTTSFDPGGGRTVAGTRAPCAPLYWSAEAVEGSAPIGSLLARVGTGSWFEVGAGKTFTAQSGGTLAFTVNDVKRSDNAGQFSVAYSVTSPG